MAETPSYYNYRALEELFIQFYDPKEIGNRLDEIMNELVIHADQDEGYRETLGDHHFLLKLLRDIFWWKLTKTTPEKNRDETNH